MQHDCIANYKNSMRKFVILSLLICKNSFAQTGTPMYVDMKVHSGINLYTGTDLTEKLSHGYKAFTFKVGYQTTGKHAWEREHRYPSFGVGYFTARVGDKEIFGTPQAIFAFINLPVYERGRFMLHVEPALGLAYGFHPFSYAHNPLNDAIGSRRAVYTAVEMGGRFVLTRELDLTYGVDITHLSNGRTTTPNRGLNMVGFNIGARYNFNAQQRFVPHPEKILEARPFLPPPAAPRKIVEDNLSLYFALGTVQNNKDAGHATRYTTSSTVVDYQHKFNTKHGFSLGFDIFHDPSARHSLNDNKVPSTVQTYFPAIHAGYDFMFWRMTIKFQAGMHLGRDTWPLKGAYFFRPAARVELTNRLFLQGGIKTYKGNRADWVEGGFGYKLFYKRK